MHTSSSFDAAPVTITWPVASLACAVLTQYISSPDAELPSEILCWSLLPALFVVTRSTSSGKFDGLNARSIASSAVWTALAAPLSVLTVVAVGVGAAALAASEFKSQALLPALIPLVLLSQRRHQSNGRSLRLRDCSSLEASLTASPLSTSALAFLAIITLSRGDLLSLLTSVPALLALLALYTTLTLRTSPQGQNSSHAFNVEEAILPLSIRAAVITFGIFLIRCTLLGCIWPSLVSVLALGLAKTCFWYTLILTTRHTQWLAAPIIKVFGIMSTVDFMSLTSDKQAFSYVLTCVLTLGQLIGLLPQHAKRRHSLWLLALIPVLPYLLNEWQIRASRVNAPDWDSGMLHPLDTLIDHAQQEFHQLRDRQSITYSIAEEEYRRRYKIDPPPGFEAWYEYAVSHDSHIIDEYDSLFKSISPFLQLSGEQVRKVMEDVKRRPANELWSCSFQGKEPNATCEHKKRSPHKDRDISLLLNELLGNVGGQVKDIEVLINHLDEPRLLYPPKSTPDGRFELRNVKRESTWADITTHCRSGTEDWNAKHPAVQQYGLPFVANRTSVMDLCQHQEYEHSHGVMISPKSLRLIEGHVPVLGTGSFSTMGDILIPSPAYIQAPFQYDDNGDVPWEKKRNNLYWDGSSTGGYVKTGDAWLRFHRQHFVSFAQHLERRSYYYLQSVGEQVVRTASRFLNGRHYDVAFTRITQCEDATCREQGNYFRTRAWTPASAALRSRLVFDIDGNGISGRFYRFLASHSLPLKQTLLREWHDDRLVPWVHFVPISQSMEELPEVVRWLTSTERGQMRAREMAEGGRRWYYEAVRDVDKGIYLYRLMLEMRRLQDVKRGAGES